MKGLKTHWNIKNQHRFVLFKIWKMFKTFTLTLISTCKLKSLKLYNLKFGIATSQWLISLKSI